MNENQPTNVQLDANGKGTVTFATDVVATIAGLAATEVEGVASMVGSSSSGLAEIFKRGQNTRSLTRGVRVELIDNTSVSIHLTIIVDYGAPVPRVAKGIQENVKKTIETMSGLEVTEVNVHVHGVSFEKENRAAAEIEAQQRLLLQKQQEEKQAEEAKEAEAAPAEPEAPVAEPVVEEEDEGEYVLDLGDEPEMDEEPAKQETEEEQK